MATPKGTDSFRLEPDPFRGVAVHCLTVDHPSHDVDGAGAASVRGLLAYLPAMHHPLDVASVDHALRTTRSVRKALDLNRPVDPEILMTCVDVALQAPTGRQREGWRFLILTDEEPKRAIAELYQRAFDHYVADQPDSPGAMRPNYRLLADRLHQMPALILACIEGRPEHGNTAMEVAHYGSILPAAWSLMVALRARGLGSTWTTLHLLHEREAATRLGIPEDVTQTVLLPVAHMRGAVLKPAARRPARELTYWNRWGSTRDE